MLRTIDVLLKRYKRAHGESWAASLSFYTLLGLPALFTVVIGIARLLTSDTQLVSLWAMVYAHAPASAGGDALIALATSVSTISFTFSAVISLTIALFATGKIFIHLPLALQDVWGFSPFLPLAENQKFHHKIKASLLKRLKSFVPILVLIGSLTLLATAYTGLQILSPLLSAYLSWESFFIPILTSFTFLILTALVCSFFFYLFSHKKFSIKQYLLSGIFTSSLLLLGQVIMGLYFTFVNVASGFGGLESAAVILLWLYYSYNIFLLGATAVCSMPDKK